MMGDDVGVPLSVGQKQRKGVHACFSGVGAYCGKGVKTWQF